MVKKCLRKKSPPQQVIQRIGALAPQDTVLVTGVGQHQVRASHFLPHDKPGSWLTSGGAGAMGYCISAALGAKTGRPEAMIDEVADRFGNQVIVLSVDARREPDRPSGFGVTTHGGARSAGLDAVEWACQAVERGAGEILLNSMDADGTADGFDIEMIEAVRAAVDVPLIASGGAGKVADFVEAARAGVDAVLAASVFHYHTLTIAQVKDGLRHAGFEVR